jgi:hypothetical protein
MPHLWSAHETLAHRSGLRQGFDTVRAANNGDTPVRDGRLNLPAQGTAHRTLSTPIAPFPLPLSILDTAYRSQHPYFRLPSGEKSNEILITMPFQD